MTGALLSGSDLAALVSDLVRGGTSVIAPAPGDPSTTGSGYRSIQRLEDAALSAEQLPRRSLKEFFLPPSEVLLRYTRTKRGVDVEEVPTACRPQVVLGARPCDAAALEILDAVMGWEPRDELWFGRREATTIVSLACPGVDSSCFCSALGLGPDATRGADALLVPLDPSPVRPRSEAAAALEEAVSGFLRQSEPFPGASGATRREVPTLASAYLVRPVTAKGEELVKGRGSRAGAADVERAERFADAARRRIDRNVAALRGPDGDDRSAIDRLPEWLAGNFDHPLWGSLATRCHGCGACAAVCPTCHCFDIVDEHDAVDRGARRRNWDSCQLAKFTLHASGHNPRPTQSERFRQRVMHKFSVYPRRFDAVLCTGCGRCARSCAAGMSILEVLGDCVRLSASDAPRSER